MLLGAANVGKINFCKELMKDFSFISCLENEISEKKKCLHLKQKTLIYEIRITTKNYHLRFDKNESIELHHTRVWHTKQKQYAS